MKKIILLMLLLGFNNIFAAQWKLLIPPSKYNTTELSFSPSGYDQIDNHIYSLYKSDNKIILQKFNLNDNTVSLIETKNIPDSELWQYSVDQFGKRIIASRSGRDKVYELSLTTGEWKEFGNGNFDAESYGAQSFWNNKNNSFSYFGGYGYFSVKNWIWENTGGDWVNTYANNSLCDDNNPIKGTSNLMLGDPNKHKLYFASGGGNCSGDQFETSCNLGSSWASDVGIWCWLRSIWELDYSTNTWTNILPTNNQSITKEGLYVYDYKNKTFYILGGYVPSPVYDRNYGKNNDYDNGVLKYQVGVDDGFKQLELSGDKPPIVKLDDLGPQYSYFDNQNNRIIWARKDGIWAIDLESEVTSCEIPSTIPKDGLIGYWPFCGNANDLSGNGNNGTVNGATLTEDRFGNTNQAYNFDNTNITIENKFYDNSMDNYTISFWGLISNINKTNQTFFNTIPHPGEAFGYNMSYRRNTLGHGKNSDVNIHRWDIVSERNALKEQPVESNKWYNFTIIKKGLSYEYYIDGKLDKNITINKSALKQFTGLTFGTSEKFNEYLVGKLDDFVIWNRALSEEEVKKVYSGEDVVKNCEVPTDVPKLGLSGYWSFCGNADDISGNGNNGVANGAILTDDSKGLKNGAYKFDGIDDYISLQEPFFKGATKVDSFSYYVKFKIDKLPAVGKGYTISGKEGYWRSVGLHINSDGSFSFSASQPSPVGYLGITSSVNLIKENQWHSIFVTFKNSTLNLYLDNKNVSTKSIDYSSFDFSWFENGNSTNTNFIGATNPKYPGITNHFSGVIDEFGTWNRELNLNEIDEIVGNGTDVKCGVPDNIPKQALIGYWPFCGNSNDESGNRNHGTNFGAVLSQDRFGNSNSAYKFNGIDNFILATPKLPLGSSPRTVAAWFKTTANLIPTSQYPDRQAITGWGSLRDEKVNFPQMIKAPSGRAYFETAINNNELYSINPLNDGKWHLIVTTYNGPESKVVMYVDGIAQDSSANINLETDNSYFGIGNASWANIPFKGEIDDVCLWGRALNIEEINEMYDGCKLFLSNLPNQINTQLGDNVNLKVKTYSETIRMQWQTNPANIGWQNIVDNQFYNGAKSNSLSINNINYYNHQQPFRLVAIDGDCIDTTNVTVLNIQDTCFVTVMDTLIIDTEITGVGSDKIQNTIKVYPNPTSDYLHLDFGNYQSMLNYTISISNILGQEVFSTLINEQNTVINTSIWGSKGVYILKIITPDNYIIDTKKIIIQ